ncbi:MAG: ferritin [Actinomycetia bacterium]|nr:ferritin [Actinomycetes bacterium]
MSAWLRGMNLDGYAHWYYVQYKEEMDHALIFYNFVMNAGGQVKLGAVEAPPSDFDSLEAVLSQTLEHEQSVTALIYAIVEEAQDNKDFKTIQFLDWFVKEQVEEEDNASTNIGRYQTFGGDNIGLHTLDQEMAARVYLQTAQLALVENA